MCKFFSSAHIIYIIGVIGGGWDRVGVQYCRNVFFCDAIFCSFEKKAHQCRVLPRHSSSVLLRKPTGFMEQKVVQQTHSLCDGPPPLALQIFHTLMHGLHHATVQMYVLYLTRMHSKAPKLSSTTQISNLEIITKQQWKRREKREDRRVCFAAVWRWGGQTHQECQLLQEGEGELNYQSDRV